MGATSADRTRNGRPVRMLAIVDEYTRECLGIRVGRHLKAENVLELLAELFVHLGTPEFIRSGNVPELTAKAVRGWLPNVEV